MAAKKHHGSAIVNFLGPSAKLSVANLPTLWDVLKQCQLLRKRHVGPANTYSVSTMAADVVPLILAVRKRANAKLIQLPICVNDDTIQKRIVRKWGHLTNIAGKTPKSRKD